MYYNNEIPSLMIEVNATQYTQCNNVMLDCFHCMVSAEQRYIPPISYLHFEVIVLLALHLRVLHYQGYGTLLNMHNCNCNQNGNRTKYSTVHCRGRL